MSIEEIRYSKVNLVIPYNKVNTPAKILELYVPVKIQQKLKVISPYRKNTVFSTTPPTPSVQFCILFRLSLMSSLDRCTLFCVSMGQSLDEWFSL